jgi:hypothetical protein
MNRSISAAFACGCLGLVIMGMSAAPSALAALTFVGFALDHTNEPNLLGINPYPGNQNPSVMETLYGEQNVRRIDDGWDTVFAFKEEFATFKVVARFSREPFFLSAASLPNAASDPILQIYDRQMGYSFLSQTEFVVERGNYLPELRLLYKGDRVLLSSDPHTSLTVSGAPITNGGRDHLVTFQVVGNVGRPNNPIGSYVLAWDDGMSRFGDRDFQDTVIEVTGIGLVVPEPSSVVLVGFAILFGGVFLKSRRRQDGVLPRCRRMGVAMMAALLMLMAAPGLAAFTPIQNALDETDEPNLIGINPYPDNLNPSVIETLYGEHNVVRVNDLFDGTFYFTDQVATVKAVAQFSQSGNTIRVGSIRSPRTVTVTSWATGTQGYRLPEFLTGTITDRARFGESFYLELNGRNGRIFSEAELNAAGSDQVVTYRVVGNDGFPTNPIGSYVLAWEVELRPGGDSDFQDVVLELRGVTLAVPEPSTAVTISLSMLAIVVWRTRSRNSHGVAT